jgi:hypothetical protein
MTPENKLMFKRIALTVGIIVVLTTVLVLIVRNNKYKRDAEGKRQSDEESPSKPSGSTGGSSLANTLEGRTFTTTEVEKMQAYMLFVGQMAQNQYLIGQIRDTGGIDGRIGAGFKNALAECIRIGVVKNLDELYQTAMKTM